MKLNPNDPLVRTAVFGQQVENFLRTDIGNYLLESAKSKKDQAVEEFKKVDPLNSAEVLKAQNEIRIADLFMDWLAEAIQNGRQASENLETQ